MKDFLLEFAFCIVMFVMILAPFILIAEFTGFTDYAIQQLELSA